MPCGDQVRKYRELRNYTQGELAGLAGLPTSAISKIENGTRNVTWDEAVRFVDVLGIRLDDLAGAPGVPLIRADVVTQELREARMSLRAAELRLAVLDQLAAGSLIQGAVSPAEATDPVGDTQDNLSASLKESYFFEYGESFQELALSPA